MIALKKRAISLIEKLDEQDTYFVVRILENLGQKHRYVTDVSERRHIIESISGLLPSSISDEEVKNIRSHKI